MLFITGQVRNERASDYVLRPLTQSDALRRAATMDEAFDLMAKGGLYSLAVSERTTADQVIFDLVNGWVALFFPGKDRVLTLMTATEEKRSVSSPENEPDVKGAQDSFVESVRTNHFSGPAAAARAGAAGKGIRGGASVGDPSGYLIYRGDRQSGAGRRSGTPSGVYRH